MPVLLFGFEPFSNYDENPTELLARKMDGTRVAGQLVTGRVLPVSYSKVEGRILEAIDAAKPSLVVGFGLAAGRKMITPEKVAVNYINSEARDNSRRKLRAAPIDGTQPDGLFTNLPVESLVGFLHEKGIPASLSLSAGAYLCNEAMFLALREARRRGFGAGFIHVPIHSEWAARKGKKVSSLPFQTIERAARLSLEYYLRASSRTARRGHEKSRPRS